MSFLRRLLLEACGFGPAAFFFCNFRLCRNRIAAAPVFQETFLLVINTMLNS